MGAARVAVLLLSLTSFAVSAADRYPVKPVRLVVSFPPGGADDAHGRLLADKLGELLVSQLNAAVVNAVASPDLQERLQKLGSEPVSSSSEQMLQRLRNDTTTVARIVKTAGIKEE